MILERGEVAEVNLRGTAEVVRLALLHTTKYLSMIFSVNSSS